MPTRSVNIQLHKGDLPSDVSFNGDIAVDTETLGLKITRDRLCLVQLCDGSDEVHLVQFLNGEYNAPNLKKVLSDNSVTKLFHYARFDIAVVRHYLGVEMQNIYCTKIVSKLVRTYTDRHGLKDLCGELIDVEISKQQQSSNWAELDLSDAQKRYAANDVLFLHRLRNKLNAMLELTGRKKIAQSCFDFLPVRCALDLAGWEEVDIFSHS